MLHRAVVAVGLHVDHAGPVLDLLACVPGPPVCWCSAGSLLTGTARSSTEVPPGLVTATLT